MRYLAISTVLVIAFIVIVTNLPHGPHADVDVRYSSSTASPGPGQRLDPSQTPPPIHGEAPWALSALPECFHQESWRNGTPAFARAELPPKARPLAPGLRLKIADCTLEVARDSAVVVRGENRFVVPPVSRFYVVGRRVILDRASAGRVDLRVYALHGDAAPDFEPVVPGQPLRGPVESHS